MDKFERDIWDAWRDGDRDDYPPQWDEDGEQLDEYGELLPTAPETDPEPTPAFLRRHLDEVTDDEPTWNEDFPI